MSRGTAFLPFSPIYQCLLMELAAWIICHIPLTQMFHPLAYSTSKKLPGCMLITRGFGQHMIPRITLFLQAPRILNRKGGDIMLKINPLSPWASRAAARQAGYAVPLCCVSSRYVRRSRAAAGFAIKSYFLRFFHFLYIWFPIGNNIQIKTNHSGKCGI